MSTRLEAAAVFFSKSGLTLLKQIRQMGVGPAREFHVAVVPRRVWCCGGRECHCRHRDRSHNKARPEPLLAPMAKEDTRLTGGSPPEVIAT